ncbi:MAG: transcriptional repressor [Chloroflexi bacterium]|jgi:Fur family ferric uptake transcriptional regulator|nr:transcriptional repressor [Dehalococcoidia bacterium]NJD64173.1 transcriptional repressor [Chloroflexota bacterium]PWB41806.1 MAG: transcriptional repressor [Dehalococcoidia bacterium]
MSCEEETAGLLRRAGHKMTPQRLMIVRALRHAEGHVSAAQIAEQVREAYPFVDVSTVYRTLDVLKRMRLATSTDMGSGDVLFEWAPEQPHHHLVCSSCGQVVEVGHEYLTGLETSLVEDFGFVADMHHFAIFGLCRGCQMAESLDADAS